MPVAELEEFARILIEEVRDSTIQSCDGQAKPGATSPAARRWRAAAAQPDKLASVMIPDCVDEAVFALLNAIDNGLLHLKFISKSGKEIDLTKEGRGELAGWYMSSPGWRAQNSKERFIDDAAGA